ncbi:deoxyuridine 5'-triphosphate nucleotidohydrolase Dut [Clostridium sp. CAG:1219]|nr:deoxyuridine 5'-triphosphate nucleotidohydrolase Dut [Clostridium sp. CAG:1219]
MGQVVKILKLKEDAKIPTRGSSQAAGYDLYALLDTESISIMPHETVKIGTGIALELPELTFLGIFARSGIATKEGLRPANCVGVVDSDYRGEIIVSIHNDSNEIRKITNYERIAQAVVLPYISVDFEIADSLNTTKRGDNGFGSTGVK